MDYEESIMFTNAIMITLNLQGGVSLTDIENMSIKKYDKLVEIVRKLNKE